ncbi:hypothetical protein ACIBEJ_40880 [Nonomuraea sp. NPDC050790]|uniref:hypothetical protein n=1 Tax=Nonomuraea sp. NPDC050790 TaxID=3364371 RepID=UPI003794EE78
MRCLQCGDPHPVPLGRRRYSCRACGAVYRAVPSAPRPVEGDPLVPYLPARMIRWVRDNDDRSPLDRETLARWYKEFDALVAKARTDEAVRAHVEEISEIPLDLLPAKPPPFPKVCAALHATCYDLALAGKRLDPSAAERLSHVRAWLAGPGRPSTWTAAPPSDPDAEHVRALIPLPDTFDAAQVRTFFCALFGVEKGPSLPGVLDRFGPEQVDAALRAYLRDGSRPLLDRVLADLDAG